MSPARISTSLMFFANGCAFASWASRIPAVQQQLQLSASVLGVALLMMGLGALCAMQVVAKLIAKFGSNRVTACACLLTAGCLFSIAFAGNIYLLGAALFVFGLCSGGMDVAMNANAVAVERIGQRPMMASFHALWSIGSMCGALLGGAIAHEGWALLQHFGLVASVVALFGLAAVRWLVPDGNGGRDGEYGDKTGSQIAADAEQAIRLLAIVCLLAFVSEGAVADWSALYMVRVLSTDPGLASVGLACFSAAMTIGRLTGDKFIERFGDFKVLALGSIITLFAVLIAIIPQYWGAALVGFFLCGIGLSTQVPITFRVAGQMRPDNPGAAIAFVARAGYLGLLLGPPILGFVADAAGLRLSLLALTIPAVVTLVAARSVP